MPGRLYADFWQVTRDALDFSLEKLGIDKPGLRERLMRYTTSFSQCFRKIRWIGRCGKSRSSGTNITTNIKIVRTSIQSDTIAPRSRIRRIEALFSLCEGTEMNSLQESIDLDWANLALEN